MFFDAKQLSVSSGKTRGRPSDFDKATKYNFMLECLIPVTMST